MAEAAFSAVRDPACRLNFHTSPPRSFGLDRTVAQSLNGPDSCCDICGYEMQKCVREDKRDYFTHASEWFGSELKQRQQQRLHV